MGKGWKQSKRTRISLILGCLFLLWSGADIGRAWAQTIVSLIPFDQEWRYYAVGGDLGTAWRTNDYNDSSWPVGRGLLQTGETTTYPAPFNTVLPPTGNNVTYYFRTRFSTPTNFSFSGMWLIATNLVDDGCVIYLNGVEAGRTRMNANPTYLALATSAPAVEGQFDVTVIDSRELRTGENVLAVEVHQASVGGIDLVWGTHLVAVVAQPLTITRQPVGQTNQVGEPITLSVAVSGTPVTYQWWKDGGRVAGATGAVHSFTATNGLSGAYAVVATNRLMSLTSVVAQVLIVPDRVGPWPESAVVRDELPGTNAVDISFNETIQASSVTSNQFVLTQLKTGRAVSITSVLAGGRTARLRVSGPNWQWFDDYVLTVNGVRDTSGNVIAPNTRVLVGWPKRDRVLAFDAVWRYHNLAFFDPGVFDENWIGRDYSPDDWWSEGSPGFSWPSPFIGCSGFGPLQQNTSLSYQREPILFRTTFNWPPDYPANATLYPRLVATDGVILFLNGQEFFRQGFDEPAVRSSSRATFANQFPVCQTNLSLTVSNLISGTNTLAAALIPAENQTASRIFALALDTRIYSVLYLPSEPAIPAVSPDGSGQVQIFWAGGGYALQTSTDLQNPLEYPFGPWTEVTNQTNPFLVVTTNEPARYFRLKKK